MQLTADMYRDILRSLRSDSRTNRNLEKRTAPRVGLRTKLTIVPALSDDPVSTWCRDLSANGIGLVHPEPLPIGSQFTALLPGHTAAPLTAVYTVVNCKELSKSLFSIGASLTRIESPTQGKKSNAA